MTMPSPFLEAVYGFLLLVELMVAIIVGRYLWRLNRELGFNGARVRDGFRIGIGLFTLMVGHTIRSVPMWTYLHVKNAGNVTHFYSITPVVLMIICGVIVEAIGAACIIRVISSSHWIWATALIFAFALSVQMAEFPVF